MAAFYNIRLNLQKTQADFLFMLSIARAVKWQKGFEGGTG